MPVLNERRKFVRYILPYGMLYVFDHYSTKVGWVRDVGMAGLSFDYSRKLGADLEPVIIDIIAGSTYLSTIPCKKIFANKVDQKSNMGHDFEIIRCGLHFGILSKNKKKKLTELINKNVKNHYTHYGLF